MRKNRLSQQFIAALSRVKPVRPIGLQDFACVSLYNIKLFFLLFWENLLVEIISPLNLTIFSIEIGS
jgi:hypothetical protein